jgi:hypothetical protein
MKLKLLKAISLLVHLLVALQLSAQAFETENEECNEVYYKYTLGMSGLGTEEVVKITEAGKEVQVRYVDFLVKTDSCLLVNAKKSIYKVTRPDYPDCREVVDYISDEQQAVLKAKQHNQVRVMIMRETKQGKTRWVFVPYQYK